LTDNFIPGGINMVPDKIRISAVKYANTYPFLHGITETGFDRRISLSTDHPAECANKLISGKADVGLVPVAALASLKEYYIITDYCLGARGKVRTVLLLSNCRFDEIETVNLDYRSLSSVTLARILADNWWGKKFEWKNTSESFDFLNIPLHDAVVLIGDQCYEFERRFRYRIDLAEEWQKFSGLPFAFACWTANKKMDSDFVRDFNNALATGVNNIPAVVKKFGNTGSIRGKDLKIYLTRYIDFILDDQKRKSISLFLEMTARLEP
jgi:chorismate dehydratase